MCVVKVRANRMLRLMLKFVALEDLLVCFFPDAFLSSCSFSLFCWFVRGCSSFPEF